VIVPPGEGPANLTIAELAERSGVTVRNIRAHQSRGLLPPPEVRGRIAYYGDRHLARLRLVVTLQAVGFNLLAIRRLLARGSGYATLLAELRARTTDGSEGGDAAWQELTPAGLEFVRSVEPDLPERLVEGGTIRRRSDGSYLVHPAIVGCIATLRDAGVDAHDLATIQLEVLAAAEQVAHRVRATLDDRDNEVDLRPLVIQLTAATWELGIGHRLDSRPD
jgi:DNA-binding transcriptional MerR regulator